MANTFLASDLHLGHKGMVTFLREDGSPQRPWVTTDEMDEALIENWNKVVRPQDTVYNLGDVVINRRCLPTLARLNGTKILVKGNHDVFRIEEYVPYFKDIRGSAKLADFLLTHIPVHPNQLYRWRGNIHGHMHHLSVHMTVFDNSCYGQSQHIDPRYLCVSMENINYTPISLEDAILKFEAQQ